MQRVMMCRRKSRKDRLGSGKTSNQVKSSLLRLFGDIAALIERIKRVGEAIVEARKSGDFLPKEFL
jgi:phage-related minor tail protein